MILISLDLGINTGVSVFNVSTKEVVFGFYKYKNTPDALSRFGGALSDLIKQINPIAGDEEIYLILEFSNFSKSKIAYLSHFGMVGITYSIAHMEGVNILTPKKQQGLGVPPQTVNSWCAKKLGISPKIYKDPESIQLAKTEKDLMKAIGWTIPDVKGLDKNQHVADSFHIGLWALEQLLKVEL